MTQSRYHRFCVVDWSRTKQSIEFPIPRPTLRNSTVKASTFRGASTVRQRFSFPAVPARNHLVALLVVGALLTGLAGLLTGGGAGAAPDTQSGSQSLYQNVDYLGADAAARLNIDFPVLVPSYVPGPFSGEPAVEASGGYYSLYWMVTGGEPTLLQVTGTVGGSLPAGSKYDLNVQLSINAEVHGNPAISDVTPYYDAVYWISGGVLYTVESRNMETDSLSLANSLVTYVGPEAPEPETEEPAEELPQDAGGGVVELPTEVTEDVGGNSDPESESTEEAEEPVVESQATEDTEDQTVEETVVVPGVPATDAAEAEPTAETVEAQPTAEAESESITEEEPEPEPTAVTTNEPVEVADDGDTSATSVGSDGTGGATLPVFGGDGTGGTMDLVVPESGE